MVVGGPPWFRPSDTNIIVSYLTNKQRGTPLRDDRIVTVANAYPIPPEQLQEYLVTTYSSEFFFINEWYFYTTRIKSKSHSFRNGFYYEETPEERVNRGIRGNNQVGWKRTLRAYRGHGNVAPENKTGWILHEYRVESNPVQARRLARPAMVMCKLVGTEDPSSESSQETSSDRLRTFRIAGENYALLKDLYDRLPELPEETSEG